MCLAVPGKVLSIEEGKGLFCKGVVDFGGVSKMISLSLVDEVKVGDYVVVHAGFALNVIDEAEAERVLNYLQEMDEMSSTF